MTEQSLRAGDSVQEIISKHSNMVYRLAYARTGNKADADDVYQEVFFRFFRSSPKIDDEAHMKAWLIRTTIHTSLNLFRSAWRRHVQALPEHFDLSEPLPTQDCRLSALRSALQRLPQKQRVVIHLHYYENYSTDEIADLLVEKNSTVRSQLKRGRDKLKLLLEKAEVENAET